jgi:hypothetical protein
MIFLIYVPPSFIASFFLLTFLFLKIETTAQAVVVQFVRSLSHTPKGGGFSSQSGHIPGQVSSPVGACVGGNGSMFLSLSKKKKRKKERKKREKIEITCKLIPRK